MCNPEYANSLNIWLPCNFIQIPGAQFLFTNTAFPHLYQTLTKGVFTAPRENQGRIVLVAMLEMQTRVCQPAYV